MRLATLATLAGLAFGAACTHPAPIEAELGLGEMPESARRELYVRLCASCHGRDGRGDGPAAAELRVPPADLTMLARRTGGTFPRERVVAVLSGERAVRAHGTTEMPIWGQRLTPGDSAAAAAGQLEQARLITALADYVESLQR
ncbi:MAG TPA: c-type cytochrome [Candidatus Limnocylindria bacterium]|nr:c-type cytochrome [Candidatus Limnocylindria bacterium]